MLRRIMLLAAAVFSSQVAAIEVVSSIKPIELIVLEITQGAAESQSLLSSNASPHDYALKPSDVRMLRGADLVVWFGHDLELYLESVLEDQANSFEIAQLDTISFRQYSDAASHDGHNHGSTDAHFWLGIEQAQQFASALALKLTEIDPDNSATYQANLEAFTQNLSSTQQNLAKQLAPVTSKGYYVFHDAYGYFESEFELNQLGYFTLSPERKPGAKTLIAIRTALRDGEVECVFQEPQFTPAVVESVTRGSEVRVGVLDPLATDIERKPGAYFEFLSGLGQSFSDCLGQ